MRNSRAFYEERLAEDLRHDYLTRRDEAAFAVNQFGGEVKFGDEPDWSARAVAMLDAEIARMALESIRERMRAK
jgi:hypothetical protein